MTQLFDLAEGDLFMSAKDDANEVYKLIQGPDDNGRALARCVLWRNGEDWVFASRDSDENWNGYANVRKVAVSVDVV
jgi:hypothetical protein